MPPAKRKRRTLPSLDRVLAVQIRALRAKQGVSQQVLAEMLGETQSTVTRIESGDRSITVSELFRIAAALDAAPVELLAASFAPDEVPVAGKTRLSADHAREWVKGERPLPGGDEGRYWTNVPAGELTVRMRMPGLYLLRGRLNDLIRAMLAGNYIAADAALDTLDHMSAETRRDVEQLNEGKPAFYKARQERAK